MKPVKLQEEFDTLSSKCKEIDMLIMKDEERFDSELSWPVLDGIVDVAKYISAKYRILWILKEVNETTEPNVANGHWDIRNVLQVLRESNGIKKGWEHTFKNIILCSHGILNNYACWDDMSYLKNDLSMTDSLKEIAYINLKNQPGAAVANLNLVKTAYERDKDIILNQIEVFNPDIIIFGGTFNLVKEDLNLSAESMKPSGEFSSCVTSKKLYISAYHPGQMTISEEVYCDSIIKAVRNWESECNNKSN